MDIFKEIEVDGIFLERKNFVFIHSNMILMLIKVWLVLMVMIFRILKWALECLEEIRRTLADQLLYGPHILFRENDIVVMWRNWPCCDIMTSGVMGAIESFRRYYIGRCHILMMRKMGQKRWVAEIGLSWSTQVTCFTKVWCLLAYLALRRVTPSFPSNCY